MACHLDRRERSDKVLISYNIPHIRSGWHDKTHGSRVYITTKMISVDKNVKEGFKWFGRGERILTYGFIWTSTIELSSMITNGYIWETDLIWTFLFEKSDPNKSETVTIITRYRTELKFFPELLYKNVNFWKFMTRRIICSEGINW